jgi:hypothetical protein
VQGKAKGERHLVEEPQQWMKSAYTLHLELSPKSIEFKNSARRQIFCPNPFQAENAIQAENIARAKVLVYVRIIVIYVICMFIINMCIYIYTYNWI